jgi:hypothetical protein
MNLLKKSISLKEIIDDYTKDKLTSFVNTFPNVSFSLLTLESQYNGIQYFKCKSNHLYRYDYYNEIWLN